MDSFNLGTYHYAVITSSSEAQRWFDIGLNWCYGFNHDEGVKCFQRALEADPDCAMAHWGISYAAGPYYNLTWREMGPVEAQEATRVCFDHVQRALACPAKSEVERRLISALGCRFQQPHPVPPEEFERWDDAYAAEMRRVHYAFPDDANVAALFVEALMMRTVRRFWNMKTGEPAPGSDTLEALAVCERSIQLADQSGGSHHPAMLHLHIHLLEMSHMPERGLHSADVLGELCPDAGHMNHMPGHIYVLCGDYDKAKTASEKAVRADGLYLAYTPNPTNYMLSCCHNLHLMMSTCMLLGQYSSARWAADKVRQLVTREVVTMPDRPKLTWTLEGYHAMKSHVLVRFGRWREIVDEPMETEPELYVVTAALQHYAKGVAFAALRQFDAAEEQREAYLDHMARRAPVERRYLNNPLRDSLAVGAELLAGEILYHRGRHEEAFWHLRRAVELDDSLSYTEPWAWMHPPRHALAALLLDQGQVEEAERVYRDDLGLSGSKVQRCTQHPDNVWTLHGLVECLKRRGESKELAVYLPKLTRALSKTDMVVSSSCLCRTAAAAQEPKKADGYRSMVMEEALSKDR